jgi:hypothetical protein
LGHRHRIVPLGVSYLELIAVVDQAAAAHSSVGRWGGQWRIPPGPTAWLGGSHEPAWHDRPPARPDRGRRLKGHAERGGAALLAAWLGDHTLSIVVRAGSPAVAAVVVSAATGEIVLGAEQP